MAKQYKRSYQLVLSSKDSSGEVESKVIDKLRINFEITKSLRSYPNLARIDIYNPNNDTIKIVTGDDGSIIFNAGYEGNLKMIFKGQIRNTFLNRQSEDRILTIYAGDGERDWQSATINKTFDENVDFKTVLNSLVGTLLESGLTTLGEILDEPKPGTGIEFDKFRGQTFSGSTKDALDQLAIDYKFQWSIQDGEVVAIPNDVVNSQSAVLINKNTGMVGSPTVTEIGADVTTLLNPDLLPNRAFIIESQSQQIALSGIEFRDLDTRRTIAEGKYKALEVIFVGDTHGDAWYSTARGERVPDV